MFFRSEVSVPAEVALILVCDKLSSDPRSEFTLAQSTFAIDADEPVCGGALGALLAATEPEPHAAANKATPASSKPALGHAAAMIGLVLMADRPVQGGRSQTTSATLIVPDRCLDAEQPHGEPVSGCHGRRQGCASNAGSEQDYVSSRLCDPRRFVQDRAQPRAHLAGYLVLTPEWEI